MGHSFHPWTQLLHRVTMERETVLALVAMPQPVKSATTSPVRPCWQGSGRQVCRHRLVPLLRPMAGTGDQPPWTMCRP